MKLNRNREERISMTEVYIATVLLAVTFLLLCWVVTQYQIYVDTHSMEELLKKPSMSARIQTWQRMFAETLRNVRYSRQEELKEENKTTFLFGVKHDSRKERSRMAGRAR